MYNFLDLVNGVAKRMNETPLTNTNFTTVRGFHSDIKSYINEVVTRINTEQWEWPFNHQYVNLTLTANQVKYPLPSDAKTVAYDTFVLKGDTSLNVRSAKLEVVDYEQHLEKTLDWELTPSTYAAVPRYVFRARDLSFGILPAPKEPYEIRYEYYTLPEPLENWDDVPTIPERFRWVILEGALYNAYMFKGDLEAASTSNALFDKGLKDMRKLYINRYEHVRSSVIGG